MATRSIVPRADGEGSVGTSAKAWGGVWAKKINGADPNLFYLVRLNSTAYIVGDIAFSPSLPSAMFLKCIEAGTTGATEPDYTGAAVGGTVTDGTVVWQYYDLLSGSGVPLGSILPYSANAQTPPYGFLFCEGQAISREMYPDLFELIGETYGAGDGENTFNLPNMLDRYPQGSSTAGTVKSAGLPNITGTWNQCRVNGDDGASGAVYYNGTTTAQSSYNSGNTGFKMGLDASQSNPIYGNSDTVTPPTLTVRWIIKAYDAPTPSSAQIDLSQYAADLAARLTREQTPAFNRRDVITVSGTYTAPVTGWYRVTVKGGGGGGQGGYTSASSFYGGASGGEGGTTIAWEKMTAGDTAAVVIGAGGTGGAAGGNNGSNGGNSTVTVNSSTYTGGGGKGAGTITTRSGGLGGDGTIIGCSGSPRQNVIGTSGGVDGAAGGGNGGGIGKYTATPNPATHGGGGAGGYGGSTNNVQTAGGNGGDGYAWFEYFLDS